MDDGWPASLGPAGSSGSDEPPRFPTGLTPTVSVSSQQDDDADPYRYRVDIISLSPANSIGNGDGAGDGDGDGGEGRGRAGGRGGQGEGDEESEREREREARVYEELLGLDRDADAEAETRHALDALVFEQLLGSGDADANADAASTGATPPTVSITDVGAAPRRWSATTDLDEGAVGDGISAPLAPERRRRPAASAVSSRAPSSAMAEGGQPDALDPADGNAGQEPYHLAIPAVSVCFYGPRGAQARVRAATRWLTPVRTRPWRTSPSLPPPHPHPTPPTHPPRPPCLCPGRLKALTGEAWGAPARQFGTYSTNLFASLATSASPSGLAFGSGSGTSIFGGAAASTGSLSFGFGSGSVRVACRQLTG